MSGEMTIEVPTARKILLINLISALLTAAVIFAAVRFLPVRGLLGGAVLAVLAYVFFHGFYTLVTNCLAASMTRTVEWELTEDSLLLEGMYPKSRKADILSYDEIESVYIWKNRTPIGRGMQGLTVNISVPHDNFYFRSLISGDAGELEKSEQSVRDFLSGLSAYTDKIDTALL